MPVSNSTSAPLWFVLNYINSSGRNSAQKIVDRFNDVTGSDLELFAPTYVVKEQKGGEVRFKTVKLAFHYVFLRGTQEEVKQLCGQKNGFSFLIDRGNPQRYATISDKAMCDFKKIANAYKNCLPYFSLDDIQLEDGDLVEVVNGDFPGLIGTYIPRPRSKSGNIVLNIYNNVGTIAFDVKASDVRVLEFSGKSTRANDQIDAFIPNLLEAMRYFESGKELPTALVAKLSVFCGRMGVVRMNNHKLAAKLHILLWASNFILGNRAEAQLALENYGHEAAHVTNAWTKGLINLLEAVLSDDSPLLERSFEAINSLKATSKLQQCLREEYNYYQETKKFKP